MRSLRWISLMLALCLLLAALPAAAEAVPEPVAAEAAEAWVPEAEALDADGLTLDGMADEPAVDEATEEALPGEDAADLVVPVGPRYAAVLDAAAPVYDSEGGMTLLALLGADAVVLVVGEADDRAMVAFNIGGEVCQGFMELDGLADLDARARAAYLDAAARGDVALYAGDINLPLAPLDEGAYDGPFEVSASGNYKEYSNDTVYTINGKDVYANMIADKGLGRCWTWAQELYEMLWGCRFTSDFLGTPARGLNLLRNLSDDERTLTPEHLKYFIQNTVPGATIRVSSCVSTCSQWANDGLSCGHKGHSLIVVDKNADGVFTMDDHSLSQHTRFYSWQGFCNAWKNYDHVKYIKWPNAPALAHQEIIDGHAVGAWNENYRARATALKGAGVFAKPGEGLLEALVYPAGFAASKKTINDVNGCAWVYGVTSSGTKGWVALNGDVANVKDKIPVTSVVLDRASLTLTVGTNGLLNAAVAPLDATDASLTWASSDPSVVAVLNGALKAVAVGSATVTATSSDGGRSASCAVTVTPAYTTKALAKTGSNGTVTLNLGEQLMLDPAFATAKGWKLKRAKSSKTAVAALNTTTGLVTAKKVGSSTITITCTNGKKATLTVKVVDPTVPTKVALNKTGTVTLKKGATLQLYSAVAPATADTTLTWKTTDAKVAAIDQNGLVTAVKKGSCYVGVYTSNGKYAKVKIKVS